jgi:hypothetical protein
MARSTFGGFGGDQVSLDPVGNSGFYKAAANLPATGTFWSASTGGTQYTDLVDPGTGVALAGVSTDAHGHVIPFKGPDGIAEGWVDFGGGRFKVTAVDSGIFLPVATLDGRYESQTHAAATYAPRPKTGRNPLTGWFHADGYGLSTANTAAANDTALSAAHTDMSNGDTLYIPAAVGAYQFSTFAPTKALKILGGLAHVRNQAAFGAANWTNGTAISSGLVAGTILQSTATTGNALNLTANGDLNGFCVENVILVGPGSGTSVGLMVAPSGGGGFPVRTRLRNVAVANFATGISASCENSQWDAIYIVGCSTGMATTWDFNGNTINGLNIEITTVAALSMTSSDSNVFKGGVIQGNTGEGLLMAGCWGNHLFFYYEGTATSGPTNDVHLTTDTGGTGLASCDNVIGGFWASHSTAQPRFLIDPSCRRNTFYGAGPHGSVINTVSNAGVNNNFLLVIAGTVTDTGRNNAYLEDGAFTGLYLPVFTTSSSGGTLQPNDGVWHLTGSAQTIHLPDPTTMRPGRVLMVKNATANTTNVVDSAGTSKTIDGAASVTLAAYQSLRVYSNGVNWFTV